MQVSELNDVSYNSIISNMPAFLNFLEDTRYKYVYFIPGKWLVTSN